MIAPVPWLSRRITGQNIVRKIDLSAVLVENGSNYPPPFNQPCLGQTFQRLGRSQGLTRFGVNLSMIPPGSWSSQRHWHTLEDEFIWVVQGELTLVSDDGEQILRVGDCAAFKAGTPDGHHLINKSDRVAQVLEIGNSDRLDQCDYPDIDMVAGPEGYRHRDGSAYPAKPD
jgi:uncharacterized cupin superfamily protein